MWQGGHPGRHLLTLASSRQVTSCLRETDGLKGSVAVLRLPPWRLQDLAGWLRRNAGAVCGGCRAGAHPLPPSLVAELREAALPETHPGYWGCLQVRLCH